MHVAERRYCNVYEVLTRKFWIVMSKERKSKECQKQVARAAMEVKMEKRKRTKKKTERRSWIRLKIYGNKIHEFKDQRTSGKKVGYNGN